MELKDIRYIVTIAEEQSFTRAAEKLYVSQPALSICVQRLEKELGASLFIREKNRLVLTPAGKMFVDDGRQVLSITQNMAKRIYDVVNFDNGLIRIGFSQFYGRYYCPELISLFQARYPGVRIEFTEDFSPHLEDYIVHDELDLAIIPLPIPTDGVAYETLFRENIYLAMPKKLSCELCGGEQAGLPAIDLRLVQDQPFIMLKKFQKIRKLGEQLCRDCGFTPGIVFETQDMNTINTFIALNMGVGFVSEVIEKTTNMHDKVSYFRLESEKAVRSFAVAYKKGVTLSLACKRFIALAHEHFSSIR